MDIDTIVRKASEPLAKAIRKESKSTGFVPPGPVLSRIVASVTSIGIDIDDALMRVQHVQSGRLFAVYPDRASTAMLTELLAFRTQRVSESIQVLKGLLAKFSNSGEKIRKSDRQFFAVNRKSSAKTLLLSSWNERQLDDPRQRELVLALMAQAKETMKLVEGFCPENTEKDTKKPARR